MTVGDVGDLVIRLGTVAGALAAIGVLLRYVVVRPVKRWVAEQSKATVDATEATHERVAAVQAEMHPNHGGSLRDAVDRVEVRQSALGDRFERHVGDGHGGHA